MRRTTHEKLDYTKDVINEQLVGNYFIRWENRNGFYAIELCQSRLEEEGSTRYRTLKNLNTGLERKDCIEYLDGILCGLELSELK